MTTPDDQQVRLTSTEPSGLTLPGLVQHLAETERDRFQRVFAGLQASPRWVLMRLMEEYARHNGHADILRERIEGVTGA